MENIQNISAQDILTFSEENNLSPTDRASLVKDFSDSAFSYLSDKYKDDPDKLHKALMGLEDDSKSLMKDAIKSEIQNRALEVSDYDTEAANDILNGLSKPKERTADGVIGDDYLGQAYDVYVREPATQKEFHLNENVVAKPAYIKDNKGKDFARIRTIKDGDSRTDLVTFFTNGEEGITELPAQKFEYKIPTDEEVSDYIAKLQTNVESETPEALKNLDPQSSVYKRVKLSFDNPQSKQEKERKERFEELRVLQTVPPDVAKELIAKKNRNKMILESDYVRNNVTDLNYAEDIMKGFLRSEAGILNAVSNGGNIDDINTINQDSSLGSQTTGLKDHGFDYALSNFSSGMESLGNMALPLAASAVTGNPSIMLGSMGASSFGQQLADTDNAINDLKEQVKAKMVTDPFSYDIKVMQDDIAKLERRRVSNAAAHALVETGTESLGGVGGVFFKNGAKTAAGKMFETIAIEYGEELAAEPLNHVADLVTFGEKFTPEMADPLALFYATTAATLPLALVGGAASLTNKESKDANSSTDIESLKKNYEAMKSAASQYAEELPEIEKEADKVVSEISGNIETNPINSVTTQAPVTVDPNTDISHLNETEKKLYESSDDKGKKEILDSYVDVPVTEIAEQTQQTADQPADQQADQQSEAKPTSLKVKKDIVDYGHQIFEASKDFASWSAGMVKNFGEAISSSLKYIWDLIVNSYKSAVNAITDATTYVKSNYRGLGISLSDAKDARIIKEVATNPTVDNIAYIKEKYPNLFNEVALDIIRAHESKGGKLDGIEISDLAKLYSFKAPGFDGGVTIVDEGTNTANLEGKDVDPAMIKPDGSQAMKLGVLPKAPVLTENEQKVLRTLYQSKVISEDGLAPVVKSWFKTKKFLALYARASGKNVENLNNAADSTITPVVKRQSKVKEAMSVGAIVDPSNPNLTEDTAITKSFVHGTDAQFDVFTHLGITPKVTEYYDDKGNLSYKEYGLSKRDKQRLYKYYDSQFGRNNWIVKDSSGAAGSGFHSAESLKSEINDKVPFYEGVAQRKMEIIDEYRVNVILDDKGKARAVPFAISKKNPNSETGQTGHHSPYRVRTKFTDEMSRFAESALQQSSSAKTDKSSGKMAVYGVDVAVINNNGKKEYKIIEFNSPDPYYDKSNQGGVSGTFSRFGGFPMMNLSSFLQGKIPADIALSNALITMIKTGQLKVDGKTIVPKVEAKKQIHSNENKASGNPNANMNSGIDPTRIGQDLKTLFRAAKDLASFTSEIIKKFGEWIKPLASEIWNDLKASLGELTEKLLNKIGALSYTVENRNKGFDVDNVFSRDAFNDIEGFKSRSKIFRLNIDDFLKLAHELRDYEFNKNTRAKDSFESGVKWESIPQLIMESGQVTGHEGRHRATVLKMAGYTEMPVEIRDWKIRWNEVNEADIPKELKSERRDGFSIPFPEVKKGNYQPSIQKESNDNTNNNQGRLPESVVKSAIDELESKFVKFANELDKDEIDSWPDSYKDMGVSSVGSLAFQMIYEPPSSYAYKPFEVDGVKYRNINDALSAANRDYEKISYSDEAMFGYEQQLDKTLKGLKKFGFGDKQINELSDTARFTRTALERNDPVLNKPKNKQNEIRYNSGIDPTRLIQDIKTVYEGVKSLARFTKDLVAKIGEWIAPFAKRIFNELAAKAGEITMDFLEKLGVGPMYAVPNSKKKVGIKADKKKSHRIIVNGNVKIDSRYVSTTDLTSLLAAETKLKSGKMNQIDFDSIAYNVKEKEKEARFKELKRNNPNEFSGMNYDSFNRDLGAAREYLISELDKEGVSEPIGSQKERKMTLKREKAINHLNEKLGEFSDYLVSDDVKLLTPEVQAFIMMGVSEIRNLNELSSTNTINRAAVTLDSFLDNGSPVGMFKYVYHKYSKARLEQAKSVADKIKPKAPTEASNEDNYDEDLEDRERQDDYDAILADIMDDPISNIRRFDTGKTPAGTSLIQVAVELDKLSGGNDHVLSFLNKLFGDYVGQLDAQTVDTNLYRDEWKKFTAAMFPKGQVYKTITGSETSVSPKQRTRMGIASILTQTERGLSEEEKVAALKKAFNDVPRGIEYRRSTDGQESEAELDSIAFKELVHNVDYDSMTSAEIISTIEGNLVPQERETLYRARDIAASFLPDLKAVAGLVGNKALVEYDNYLKLKVRSNLAPDELTGGIKAFDGMQPILSDRNGGIPMKNGLAHGYYETDLFSLVDQVIREATYEKHTGVQRSLIKELLNSPQWINAIEKPNKRADAPRTARMKQLLGNYHSQRTGNGAYLNPLAGMFQAFMGISKASNIASFHAFFANAASAIPNLLAIQSISDSSNGSLLDVMYNRYANRKTSRQMKQFLKDNFPSQFERLSKIEEARPAQSSRSKSLAKAALQTEAGVPALKAYLTNSFGIAADFALDISKKVIDKAAYVSAAFIESALGTDSFWTLYIRGLNESGQYRRIASVKDFLSDPIVDRNIATDAMLKTDKIFGVASMSESNGGMYHNDNGYKLIMTNMAFYFSRQQIQLKAQAGNELWHMENNHLDNEQQAKRVARLSSILGSMMFYNAAKYAVIYGLVSSPIAASIIAQFINGDDDEKEKQALREEIARRVEMQKQKANQSMMFDMLTSFLGMPLLEGAPIKGLASHAFDTLHIKPLDKVKQDQIDFIEEEIKIDKARIHSNELLGDKKTVSKLMNGIQVAEQRIKMIKAVKGIRTMPFGERLLTDSMGAFAIFIKPGHDIIDWFEEKNETTLARNEEVDILNNVPWGARIMDTLVKSGVTQISSNVIRNLAEEKVKIDNENKRKLEEARNSMLRKL